MRTLWLDSPSSSFFHLLISIELVIRRETINQLLRFGRLARLNYTTNERTIKKAERKTEYSHKFSSPSDVHLQSNFFSWRQYNVLSL